MINENALRDALVALATQCKTQQDLLSHVMDEVAALRETVRGLDPTFSDVLDVQRKNQSNVAIRRIANQLIDDLIRRLKDEVVT